MTLKFNGVLEVMQNIIELSAVVHELLCPQLFLPYLAMVKKPIIWSFDLDLWPWNSSGLQQLSRYMFVQNVVKLQRLMSYLAQTEEYNSNENNTVRRYRGR